MIETTEAARGPPGWTAGARVGCVRRQEVLTTFSSFATPTRLLRAIIARWDAPTLPAQYIYWEDGKPYASASGSTLDDQTIQAIAPPPRSLADCRVGACTHSIPDECCRRAESRDIILYCTVFLAGPL
jgi:hypothetical protein